MWLEVIKQVKIVILYNNELHGITVVHLSAPTVHEFIYETSHYVQLFASHLVWTTQAQFTACLTIQKFFLINSRGKLIKKLRLSPNQIEIMLLCLKGA